MRPNYLTEVRQTLALAFPIVVGQVSQILMGITDSVMIGRIGKVQLAASAFANGLFNLIFICGLGMLLAVSVLVSRAHGARQSRDCADYLRHGLVLALGLSVVSLVLIGGLATQLHRFGQPAEVLAVVNPFFVIIGVSLVPAFLFQVFKQFSEAVGHPWVPMVILLGCVGLNALLNWLLIYGHWGLPELGLAGSAYATLTARTVSVLLLWWWLSHRKEVRCEWPSFAKASESTALGKAAASATASEVMDGVRNPAWFAPFSAKRFREMLAVGVPAAGQWLFEAGAFSAAAIMMGWVGTVSLAAHQVALSCASSTFMFPLGLSIATSMRVSRAVGEGRRDAVRVIGFGSLGAGFVMMGVFAVLFALGGRWFATGFTPDAAVIELTARLLVVAAFFQLFDGVQVIGAGALRGLTDVKIPTLITLVAYWGIALPGGYLLGVRGPFGPEGIWAGLALGLAFAAVLLTWRFYHKTDPKSLSPIM
jgi:MATE family multidrug resistance protein